MYTRGLMLSTIAAATAALLLLTTSACDKSNPVAVVPDTTENPVGPPLPTNAVVLIAGLEPARRVDRGLWDMTDSDWLKDTDSLLREDGFETRFGRALVQGEFWQDTVRVIIVFD
jgi:hypothetical protein